MVTSGSSSSVPLDDESPSVSSLSSLSSAAVVFDFLSEFDYSSSNAASKGSL
jgi:hypothetical protein